MFPLKPLPRYGWRKPEQTQVEDEKSAYHRTAPKPEWVKKEVIRLKALMPQEGCRKIADVFNRRFEVKKKLTVGRTYVNDTIQKHQYEIQVLRRRLKHRKPRPIPKNLIWAWM